MCVVWDPGKQGECSCIFDSPHPFDKPRVLVLLEHPLRLQEERAQFESQRPIKALVLHHQVEQVHALAVLDPIDVECRDDAARVADDVRPDRRSDQHEEGAHAHLRRILRRDVAVADRRDRDDRPVKRGRILVERLVVRAVQGRVVVPVAVNLGAESVEPRDLHPTRAFPSLAACRWVLVIVGAPRLLGRLVVRKLRLHHPRAREPVAGCDQKNRELDEPLHRIRKRDLRLEAFEHAARSHNAHELEEPEQPDDANDLEPLQRCRAEDHSNEIERHNADEVNSKPPVEIVVTDLHEVFDQSPATLF